ncbi:zinc finger protein 551-like isoform X4 [Planococcus citri]|uniref:zinc finger protein 551-like isoform X4 n=1 Tax=Planococcus citri TaxID=170843 RepID=UPI0031F99072
MNLLNSFSREESARRVHNIGCCHSASHQYTNHNSRQFRDDACTSGLRSELLENEAEEKDLCVVCGWVSANEFFSFPSDVGTRKQWATFCDLPLDKIKPHFHLCDRHFKPDDYRISIQRKLLIQTSSVPTLQPKLKHGFGLSTSNSLQSSLNSINISNPTLNENTSKNAIYSPVVQGNLRSEIFKLRTGCLLLENTVAELKKGIERLDERCFVVPAEIDRNVAEDTGDQTAINGIEGTPQHQSLTTLLLEKTNDDPCNTNTRLPEQDSEKDATASTEIAENVTKATCGSNSTMFSVVECIDSLSNADVAPPEDHSKKVAFVESESVENVLKDTHNIDSILQFPGVSNDDLHNTQERLEQHSEEIAIAESVENIAEDGYSIYIDSSMPPLEISNDVLHSSEDPLEQFSKEVARSETSRNVGENNRNFSTVASLENSNSSPCNTETQPNEHFEKEAYVEHVDEDNQFPNLTALSTQILNDDGRCNAEVQSQQHSEGDSASKDSQNCFSDLTQTTNDVPLDVLDNDEVVSGISVSPQINCQLRRNDTFTNSNNEQFDEARDGQTLRMEQVQVTTQQPNCNDEQNVFQCNGHASTSAGCSKRQKNDDEGPTTRSAKKKKELPSAATTIQTSDSVPKKVGGVLMRDSPPYCCNICDKTFSDKHVRTRHQREHLKRFKCRKCGKQFPYKSYLIKHQRTQSEKRMRDSPPYCCNICDKTFSDKCVWTKHQRKHPQRFYCRKCDKRCVSKSHLIQHEATHNKNKPHKCSFCDTRFKHKYNKVRHERYMHTEVTCFECAVCGKMFNYKHSIIQHLRVHSVRKPFRCQACGTRFSRKDHLVDHKRTHSEEKKFKCGICNKLFKHICSKISHERLHAEGSRFECALCGRKYRTKTGLAYHISHNCS